MNIILFIVVLLIYNESLAGSSRPPVEYEYPIYNSEEDNPEYQQEYYGDPVNDPEYERQLMGGSEGGHGSMVPANPQYYYPSYDQDADNPEYQGQESKRLFDTPLFEE